MTTSFLAALLLTAAILAGIVLFIRAVLWLREKDAQIIAFRVDRFTRTVQLREGTLIVRALPSGQVVYQFEPHLSPAVAPATPPPRVYDIPDPSPADLQDDALRKLAIDILVRSEEKYGPKGKDILPADDYGGDPSRWVKAVRIMKPHGVVAVPGKGTWIVNPNLTLQDLRIRLVNKQPPPLMMSFATPPSGNGGNESDPGSP